MAKKQKPSRPYTGPERQRPSVSEQQLASIVESAEDAIYSRTLDGKIVTWNPGAENMYGYKASEAIGKPVKMLVPREIPRDDINISEKIKRGERVEHYVTQRRHKDGHIVIVDLTVSPLKDAKGKSVGVASIARDITAQETMHRRQREFVSIASHELRTPLTALTGYLSLAESADDEAMVREFVGRAFKASTRLTNLVEDLLEVARLEENRTAFDLTLLQPEPIVREVVEELRRGIEQKRIKLTMRNELKSSDHIMVDPNKFNRVIRNLLDNAIKYTPREGRITITLTGDSQHIRVKIRDSGIGIEQKNLDRIFDKFFREYTQLSVAAGGTGLGLFITKQLVERMGGSLKLRSRRNVGTTATLELPRARRKSSDVAGTRRRSATMRKKK